MKGKKGSLANGPKKGAKKTRPEVVALPKPGKGGGKKGGYSK